MKVVDPVSISEVKQDVAQVAINIPVRTYDIDCALIVSNIVYIRWLEDLRLTMLESYYPLERCVENGLLPVLTATVINYKKSVRLFDKVEGKMHLHKKSNSRFQVDAEFSSASGVHATARQTGLFIDMKTGQPARLPEELQALKPEISSDYPDGQSLDNGELPARAHDVDCKEKAAYAEVPLKVGTYDVDSAQHVNNIVYFRWLEDMRMVAVNKLCPFKELVALGYMPVLVGSKVEYKKGINLWDEPLGKIWFSRYGNTSVTMQAEIVAAGILRAVATHILVFIDVQSGRPKRLPDSLLKRLSG